MHRDVKIKKKYDKMISEPMNKGTDLPYASTMSPCAIYQAIYPLLLPDNAIWDTITSFEVQRAHSL